MFADVVGSTRLYEALGDIQAHEQIERCLSYLASLIKKNNGKVIQTIGDEVMCQFPNADTAVKAACEIQRSLNLKSDYTCRQLQVRIGLQYGPVALKGEDIFGDTINIAARMSNLAKARQIFTTEYTINNLSLEYKKKARRFDRLPVKGKQEEITVYQIIWEESPKSLTNLMPTLPLSEATLLNISYKDITTQITGDSLDISIGRSKECDITIESPYASRIHGRFEHRRGKKIVFVDLSTNGTYIKIEDIIDVYLHREELLLSGTGIISLGEPIYDNNKHLIYFNSSSTEV